MNPDLQKLHPYPFERLTQLKSGITPPEDLTHIALSIGEPKHEPPAFVVETLKNNLDGLASYPMAPGIPELRAAIARWLTRRFKLAEDRLDIERHILPLTGTREGLFALTQAVVEDKAGAAVMMPNPFYQIYEGAALLAGAEPVYLNTTADNDYLPDLDAISEADWDRCQLLFLCTPGNPTGKVMNPAYLKKAIALADKHDFVIVSDECYSEIYLTETPPPGLLEVCESMGRHDFKRCLVMHSLSKRSNVPGLRSGFVAGDAEIIKPFRLYRTYHGCAMPLPAQKASIPAWDDDAHVKDNRAAYRAKFDAVLPILEPVLPCACPEGGFYLWVRVPGGDDEAFAQGLFREQNITALPGSYLSRDTAQGNPGQGHLRISLVATVEECTQAAHRIRQFIEGQSQ
ncbi:N-succinyldiaminopimelate aminotransferase [Natronospira proteinivora]|uniref:N-succinyldiaminopimelate aminotransferase n=1 Tax=Natronospira proteinivora TaxID=1807133 RepID=A0ABT1G5N2_9GAMM|nr:succinyldiaminopimelate transaminase [Natronospira proteinivora]MCP1726614.1 N-succinyldiaminopimelate aminotransferase [Natronospira proteinivora]